MKAKIVAFDEVTGIATVEVGVKGHRVAIDVPMKTPVEERDAFIKDQMKNRFGDELEWV